MSRSARGGFTLIELLVVITIIGMLMALLVPAAGAVRARMQALTCSSNQRQVGEAILHVVNQSTNGQFPGYRNIIKPNSTDASKSFVVSWVVMALPFLQQKPLYDQFRDGNPPANIPYLEILVCPSDPPENSQTPALDYIVNCGKPDVVNGTATVDKAANGLFFDRAPTTTAVANSTAMINSTLAKIVDGAEYTLMVSENMNLVKMLNPTSGWGESGTVSQTGIVTEPEFGFVWWNDNKQADGTVSPFRAINGGRLLDITTLPTPPTAQDYARPASNHNGGVNVCFASGRETWLKQDISYYVYQQLMTPDGANATPPAVDSTGAPYILADGDYKY